MAQAGAMGRGTPPGADAAQRRQAALSGVCEGLWAQWIFLQPEGDRAFLQHTRRPAALPGWRSGGGDDLLAGARGDRQHEQEPRRPAWPFGCRGGRDRGLHADAERWVLFARYAVVVGRGVDGSRRSRVSGRRADSPPAATFFATKFVI